MTILYKVSSSTHRMSIRTGHTVTKPRISAIPNGVIEIGDYAICGLKYIIGQADLDAYNKIGDIWWTVVRIVPASGSYYELGNIEAWIAEIHGGEQLCISEELPDVDPPVEIPDVDMNNMMKNYVDGNLVAEYAKIIR